MKRAACLLTCLVGGLAGGCESVPRAGLTEAVREYRDQDYDAAYADSMEVLRRRRDPETRCSAAYVAGLCAWQFGDRIEAERRWTQALESRDRRTSARARAMLGVLALERGRHEQAATLLAEASHDLDESDARNAAKYAAVARSVSLGGVGITATRRTTPDTGLFALQAGAFRELERAQTAAEAIETGIDGSDVGPVFIVPSTDGRGQSVHLVQFGAFSDRHEADQARRRLGRLEYIVAPIR